MMFFGATFKLERVGPTVGYLRLLPFGPNENIFMFYAFVTLAHAQRADP
jgi:hypothetical protein